MKSRFFTDTQELDAAPPPCHKVYVCLLMSEQAVERALQNACRLHMTSGEYIDHLILNHTVSACGTRGLPPSDTRRRRFPPAPPDH